MKWGLIKSNQSGIVLVVCLIWLLVLTILGVSSVRTSNLEGKVASNTLSLQSSLNIAESAASLALASIESSPNQLSGLISGIDVSKDVTPSINLSSASITEWTSSSAASAATDVDVSYVGEGIPEGYSLGVNGGFKLHRFEIVSRGAIETGADDTVVAETTVTQGLARLGF
ncbi:pilus assembly PilX family protein [Pelagibaculum spongiae]|uniref:Type 4 fimbrial biogenesis protein PilX N-terminal domain-containing protein n=1 Tax=Pelagibaculum spongiae TaxID=2080658 RepID=A0A2V1GVM6_9GAMM|nr:PilX N-terminal domain-containing pilus assembly protein [Pelagibaculum spongiae]PVZ70445.1 hypothetical protein DC094_07610 [Pelagibaculum spongiae]